MLLFCSGQYAKNLAESFFVIADDFVMKLAGEKVVNGLQSHDIRCHAERFNGECSHAGNQPSDGDFAKTGLPRGWSGSAVVKPSIPRRRSVTTRSCRWW